MNKKSILIKNARIVNEGTIFHGDVLIEDQDDYHELKLFKHLGIQ